MRPAALLRFAATAALVLAGACNSSKNAASVEGSPMPPSNLPPAPAPAAPAAAAATANTHGPAPTMAAPGAAAGILKGKLAEKIDTKDYSYLRVTSATGDAWAAVPTTDAAVGTDVTVSSQMVMENFQSKTLNRTFDKLIFGTLEGGPTSPNAAAAAANPHGAANPHAGATATPGQPAAAGSPHATVPEGIGDLKVAKAEGADGRTVAEVFAQKGALKDKSVAVRGKVVKFTGGVMGKNWIHIRDASGSEAAGDNDLTATTADEVKVGDTVLIKGTVHTERDFGAGYKYAVIVEDAKLGK